MGKRRYNGLTEIYAGSLGTNMDLHLDIIMKSSLSFVKNDLSNIRNGVWVDPMANPWAQYL
jgi:hypothetical protein